MDIKEFTDKYTNKYIKCYTNEQIKYIVDNYITDNISKDNWLKKLEIDFINSNRVKSYNKEGIIIKICIQMGANQLYYGYGDREVGNDYIKYDDIFKPKIVNINDVINSLTNSINTHITTKNQQQMEEKVEIKLSDVLNHFKNGVERYECDNQGVGSIQSIYSLTEQECDNLFKHPMLKGRRVKKLTKTENLTTTTI